MRPNPNAVSRALMFGVTGIVFLTFVTVITNELPVQLLTVNVAVARRVASAFTPCQVTVNDVFPGRKTCACAEAGTAETMSSDTTETATRRIVVNVRMRLLVGVTLG